MNSLYLGQISVPTEEVRLRGIIREEVDRIVERRIPTPKQAFLKSLGVSIVAGLLLTLALK